MQRLDAPVQSGSIFRVIYKMPVSQVIKLLRVSKRPLIHVGQGVRIAGAIEHFFRLVESLQIPFVTARNANDICASDHPLYIGRPGTFAQRGANFAVQTCDFYLAIGTRLSLPQTGYNTQDYARSAKIIQVDIDQAELDKGTIRHTLKICLDAKKFIQKLPLTGMPDWTDWLTRCQRWKIKYPVMLPEYKDQIGSVNSYYFIDVLSDLASPDDTIVTDMGFAFQNTHQAWKVKKGQRLLTNCGLAPMGWGLPAAVGAAFATARRVICITGEGGLMMNIQELATVMHHNLNIKIFVLKNGGYLTIKQTQQLGFEGRLMGVNQNTGLSFPNFERIALAHKIYWDRSFDHLCLKKQIADTLQGDRAAIREIVMSIEQPQAPRAINRRNPDGTMNPTKLEDAWPFLPPEIIMEEMKLS